MHKSGNWPRVIGRGGHIRSSRSASGAPAYPGSFLAKLSARFDKSAGGRLKQWQRGTRKSLITGCPEVRRVQAVRLGQV